MNAFTFRFLRIYARFNNARRIWASTPQNCATTHRTTFEKGLSLQGISVGSEAIYRLYVFVLFLIEKALNFIIVDEGFRFNNVFVKFL